MRILVLLAVLTMNETAVVPFTLLFLATLEAFFRWPLVRRLVYRILPAVALITISLGCLCRIGEQLDIAVLKRLETNCFLCIRCRDVLPAVNAFADHCMGRPETPWTSGALECSVDAPPLNGVSVLFTSIMVAGEPN